MKLNKNIKSEKNVTETWELWDNIKQSYINAIEIPLEEEK